MMTLYEIFIGSSANEGLIRQHYDLYICAHMNCTWVSGCAFAAINFC